MSNITSKPKHPPVNQHHVLGMPFLLMRLPPHLILLAVALSTLATNCDAFSSAAASTPLQPVVASAHDVRTYFATCIPGLENALAAELKELGAAGIEPGRSGVKFTENPENWDDDSRDGYSTTSDGTSMEIGLKALLWLRTAHRVMELIVSTDDDEYYEEHRIADKDGLYSFIRDTVDVKSLLGDGRGGMLSLAVKATTGGYLPKELCHSHFSALTVKNALVDSCRELRTDGLRPDVDTDDPSVPLVLALRGSEGRHASASLYRCLSGHDSMHRRGYRGNIAIHKAAMKESLAAGLLLESGWHLLVKAAKNDGQPAVLVDPMAGSGTFCIEAALMAADLAPGLLRQRVLGGKGERPYLPPAVRWKTADVDCWKRLLQDAVNRAKIGREWLFGINPDTGVENCLIMGNEVNEGALDLALQCSKQAGVGGAIHFHEGSCQDWHLEGKMAEGRTILVVNPPWNLRLTDEIEESWEALKVFLRRECGGVEAWVLSGNKDLTRILRMKKSRSVPINTADEKLRWIQYHIFKPKDDSQMTTDTVHESLEQR